LNPMRWISLYLTLILTLTAITAHAQDAITITHVDPSHFPDMVVYIDALASDLPAGLTKEDFTVTEDGVTAEIIDFAGEGEPRPVDVIFVIDTTGSMGDEITGVINTSVAFADQLRANNRDFRLGLVTFSDQIEVVRNTDQTLTADAEEFKGWVSELAADGGDDDPEASLDGLKAATEMTFRADAQKVFILITDAPPHERGDGTPFSQVTANELTTQLRDGGFTVYDAAYADPRYRTIVNETSGKFYELTPAADFIGIIDEIGGDIAKQYRLTYRSPRASYDGTKRNIVISVGGKTGEDVYLEEHVLNIQSNPLIGVILLAPLLLALVIPAAISRRRRPQTPPVMPAPGMTAAAAPGGFVHTPPVTPVGAGMTGGSPPQASTQASVPVQSATGAPIAPTASIRCTNCGNELRSDAKFCGRCGQTVQAAAAAGQPPIGQAATGQPATVQPTLCPQCGRPVRPGAKFCGVCGQQL
jgi:hypothetical protein